MDNDNKVVINNPHDIHEKVMLFLGDELSSLHKNTDDQLYNIDQEYAKTRKHKSPFAIIVLAICFVAVFGVAFLMNKVISDKNKDITVSLQEFEDLNLKGLLDTVSNAQSNYDNAIKNKAVLEADLEVRLKSAQDTYDNDIFVLDSMNLSNKKTYNARVEEIKDAYNENLKQIHEEFDPQIIRADKEIAAYKEQLAEFDTAKVQAAREQEKALDTERKLRELEEKRLTEKYENRIAELNEKNSAMQRKHTEDIRNSVASVSQKYQAEIDTLDPKLNDVKANGIISKVQADGVTDLNGTLYAEEKKITDERYNSFVSEYQNIYEDFKYLDNVVASIPQKYSIPKYVSAARGLVNEMGETFLNVTADYYDETVQLNSEIDKLNQKQEELRNEMKAQQNLYETNLEYLLTAAKTNAIVLNVTENKEIAVFVSAKARFLITDVGADAEIRTAKPIKGKIFKNENDEFYFVIGTDKEGKPLEVDFLTLEPGISIKILSK